MARWCVCNMRDDHDAKTFCQMHPPDWASFHTSADALLPQGSVSWLCLSRNSPKWCRPLLPFCGELARSSVDTNPRGPICRCCASRVLHQGIPDTSHLWSCLAFKAHMALHPASDSCMFNMERSRTCIALPPDTPQLPRDVESHHFFFAHHWVRVRVSVYSSRLVGLVIGLRLKYFRLPSCSIREFWLCWVTEGNYIIPWSAWVILRHTSNWSTPAGYWRRSSWFCRGVPRSMTCSSLIIRDALTMPTRRSFCEDHTLDSNPFFR